MREQQATAPVADRAAHALDLERQLRARRLQELPAMLEAIGVSVVHRRARMADAPPRARAIVNSFLDAEERTGLLVKGPVGTGKTHLAVAVIAELIARNGGQPIVVRYGMARQHLRRIWATFREGATEREEQVVRALARVPLLVIDDLGHEGAVSEGALGVLHEILTLRTDNFRPTIITTNLTLAQIGQHYAPSIESRLATWWQVTLDGPDRRLA